MNKVPSWIKLEPHKICPTCKNNPKDLAPNNKRLRLLIDNNCISSLANAHGILISFSFGDIQIQNKCTHCDLKVMKDEMGKLKGTRGNKNGRM